MGIERKFIREALRKVLLKEYLMRELRGAYMGGMRVRKTPLGTHIVVEVSRPGLVIGRKGERIREIERKVKEEFGFENPQIEVKAIQKPELNPQVMAESIALAIERGWKFRRVAHQALDRIMRAGARGVQIVISGKLTGDRARSENFKAGKVKHCGEPAFSQMRKGFAIAVPKQGVIGVYVAILPPGEVLPDEVVVDEEEVRKLAAAEGEGAEGEEHGGAEEEARGAEE
ncbi:MAG: 30S ribosomal protein S3 [Thermoplasmata archaeon]|nr:MAG: 30S ribosomal protein S3 [Thermoplasmata archaeon]HDJ26793.1 30S ribosomal protein S3 [Aciduliprofundum sp.]